MKKALLILITAALCLALCGCGALPSLPAAAPAEPTAAAEAAPVPETLPPEEPGTGRITVHMSRASLDVLPEDGDTAPKTVSLYLPSVTVTHREEAQNTLNALLREESDAFASDASSLLAGMTGEARIQRVCLVPRQDRLVFTVLYIDRYPNGSERRSASTFSSESGERLVFSDLAPDTDALLALCSEYAGMMGGETPDLSAAASDGHWYLSAEGLVLLHSGGELTVPYPVLMRVMAEKFMPPEEAPVRGQLYAAYTNDIHAEALDILDELTLPGGLESVLFWVRGSLRNVRAVSMANPDSPDGELIWTCSRLEDGEAVRFNITVPEGEPLFRLYWETDRGAASAMLCRSAEDGTAELRPISETAALPFPEAVG